MTILVSDPVAMSETIRVSIAKARAVGKPDPTDDELYFDLALNGFPGTPAVRAFQRAKELALAGLNAAIDVLALALFVGSILMWAYGLGGGA